MTLTFFDRFILYLALELFKDAQSIQEWLHKNYAYHNHHHNDHVKNSIHQETPAGLPLYWRSRPNLDQQPLFVDVTFSVTASADGAEGRQRPKLQIRFGYLYSRTTTTARAAATTQSNDDDDGNDDDDDDDNNNNNNNNSHDGKEKDYPKANEDPSYYVSWRRPFSAGDLKTLAQSLDLVLVFDDVKNNHDITKDDDNDDEEEATARAFSASFARALEESKFRFGNVEDDPVHSLQCYYSELDQWGCLKGPSQDDDNDDDEKDGAGWTKSELDATCTHLLFQNLRSFDIVSSDNMTTTATVTTTTTTKMTTITELDRTTVKDALEQYLTMPLLHPPVGGEPPSVETPGRTTSKSSSSIPVVVSTVPTHTKTGGYRQMPKKRRRGPSELKFKTSG